ADAARPVREDLPESPALSILKNGPQRFAGRRVGALVSDGISTALLQNLRQALDEEGASLKLVAAHVGGVETDDGAVFAATEQYDGGPSVLFDAVVLLTTQDGARAAQMHPAARDFVADAVAHAKFVGYVSGATSLLAATGVDAPNAEHGFLALDDGLDACRNFVARCRDLRCWSRPAAAGVGSARGD
ncbi:MAG: catalase HPII, partial [Gammaproteobacteria bacterium]